ncbi:uncharacterized protein LOC116415929 [Nasonia vitripennis]|uniref:Uncharacterized protein n=1 Tax=Nasonia vitripennis TaxID=7425 RepID=A0A7M7PXB7_NASVI|nr:uncharacterized protein LOC116415929 [Nasonia vitripennis]
MTDAVEKEIKLTQNSSKETVEVDMSNLDIEPGKNTLSAAVIKDQLRIKEAEKQTEMNSKEARRLRRQLNIPTADNEYIWLGVFRGLISIETQSDNQKYYEKLSKKY